MHTHTHKHNKARALKSSVDFPNERCANDFKHWHCGTGAATSVRADPSDPFRTSVSVVLRPNGGALGWFALNVCDSPYALDVYVCVRVCYLLAEHATKTTTTTATTTRGVCVCMFLCVHETENECRQHTHRQYCAHYIGQIPCSRHAQPDYYVCKFCRRAAAACLRMRALRKSLQCCRVHLHLHNPDQDAR